uniref:Uncharacterized protein MANES_11G069800 n=1 Tax=Rhizophora mucronata TaxID=61149 RepID=A0A2P2MU10_RHIMU
MISGIDAIGLKEMMRLTIMVLMALTFWPFLDTFSAFASFLLFFIFIFLFFPFMYNLLILLSYSYLMASFCKSFLISNAHIWGGLKPQVCFFL